MIGVCSIAIYTRLLQPKDVGQYALFVSVALLAAAICFGWLRVAALRWLSGANEEDPRLIATIALLFAGCSLLAAGTLSVIFQVYIHPSAALLLLVWGATISSAWFDLNATVLQARLKIASYGTLNMTRSIVSLAVSIFLIHTGATVIALLGGFISGNLSALIASAFWRPVFKNSFSPSLGRQLLRFGWPASVTGALGPVNSAFDRMLLSVSAGTAAVGLYAVPFDFARQSILLLMLSATLAAQPLAMKRVDNDSRDAIESQLRQNATLLLGIVIPVVAAACLLAPELSNLLGVKFRAVAASVIAMVSIITALSGLRTFYFDQAFELKKKTWPQAIISSASSLTGIALSWLMIPRIGIMGAVASATISAFLGLCVSAAWGRVIFPMPIPSRGLAKISLATAAMGVALWILPRAGNLMAVSIHAALASLVYVAAVLLLKPALLLSHINTR